MATAKKPKAAAKKQVADKSVKILDLHRRGKTVPVISRTVAATWQTVRETILNAGYQPLEHEAPAEAQAVTEAQEAARSIEAAAETEAVEEEAAAEAAAAEAAPVAAADDERAADDEHDDDDPLTEIAEVPEDDDETTKLQDSAQAVVEVEAGDVSGDGAKSRGAKAAEAKAQVEARRAAREERNALVMELFQQYGHKRLVLEEMHRRGYTDVTTGVIAGLTWRAKPEVHPLTDEQHALIKQFETAIGMSIEQVAIAVKRGR
jgi:hypothetical protein